MSGSETYRRIRTRLIELAAQLGPGDADIIVAATPQWSVTDVFRHLAGSCADVLDGRLEGVTTDPWTQAQVDRRAGVPLDEVIGEWTELAPAIDALVDELDGSMDPRFFVDAWTHEQDLRGTLARPGGADDAVIADHLAGSIKGACIRVRRAGLDPIEITSGPEVNQSGENPAVRLRVAPFELMRGVLGRRSRAQLSAWDWTWPAHVDPDAYFTALMVFGMAEYDIRDAV